MKVTAPAMMRHEKALAVERTEVSEKLPPGGDSSSCLPFRYSCFLDSSCFKDVSAAFSLAMMAADSPIVATMNTGLAIAAGCTIPAGRMVGIVKERTGTTAIKNTAVAETMSRIYIIREKLLEQLGIP